MGTEDQEDAEVGASFSGKVQTNRWTVLPPVHPRQSGECAALRPEKVKN